MSQKRPVTDLVLEGGGLRCAFTMGILDGFLEEGIRFPRVSGVSAGAISGAFYVAGQQRILQSPCFRSPMPYSEWTSERGLLDMTKMAASFDGKLSYDFSAFQSSPSRLRVGALNAHRGVNEYFETGDFSDCRALWQVIMASSSLPSFSEPVAVEEELYYDGGLADPIPLPPEALEGRALVILTQHISYEQTNSLPNGALRRAFGRFPAIREVLRAHHADYDARRALVCEKEKAGDYFVFRPSRPVEVGVYEQDTEKILDLYADGAAQVRAKRAQWQAFLQGDV